MEKIAKPAGPANALLIRIGRIIGVHGLRGGLRFRPDNPDSDSIENLERIFVAVGSNVSDLEDPPSEYRVVDVASVGHGAIRLMLDGIGDATQAEALKGKTVFADQRDLPTPEEHEFYHYEAIGCEVMLTDGRRIGTIAEVFATGANDVFVVRGEGGEVLVPVIADVVKEIDVANRRVVIEAVPGLLD